MKTHILNQVVADYQSVTYFYIPDGGDWWRVYILDPDGSAAYEIVFHCSENKIPALVRGFIREAQE